MSHGRGMWGIVEVLLFSLPVAICMPQSLSPLIGLWLRKWYRRTFCVVVSFTHLLEFFFYIFRNLMTRRFHHPNIVIYVYPEPSNHHLDSKTICEKFSGARIQQKHLGLFFAALNGDCSIQDGCRELKLVWLEPSGHKDSEYVRKYFLAHLWMKQHCKTSEHFIKILYDGIGIGVPSGVLAGERSAPAP